MSFGNFIAKTTRKRYYRQIMDYIHIIQTCIHRDRSYKYFHPSIKTTILITMYMLPSIHHCIHIRITPVRVFVHFGKLSNILMNAMFPCCTCDVAWDTNERYSMRSKMSFERGSCREITVTNTALKWLNIFVSIHVLFESAAICTRIWAFLTLPRFFSCMRHYMLS